MSDILGVPKGWKLERVDPPAQHKLPSSEYSKNWDAVFGKKEDAADEAQSD